MSDGVDRILGRRRRLNPAGKFAGGDLVWVNTSYKHPGVRGRLPIRRKARVVRRELNWWYSSGSRPGEEGYEIRFLDGGREIERVGAGSMWLLSPLEQLAQAADDDQ